MKCILLSFILYHIAWPNNSKQTAGYPFRHPNAPEPTTAEEIKNLVRANEFANNEAIGKEMAKRSNKRKESRLPY